ncbi:MAG: winged helix-turn-helix domain-containing protein [Micrococcaceae bacterium]
MTDGKTPQHSSYAALPGESDLQLGAKAMKAFAHPLRMQMYTYLSDRGSATATQLAEVLNESTGQTSYHLRQLEKHGLVEEDSGRGSGRERWWKPVGYSLRQHMTESDINTDPALDVMLDRELRDRSAKLEHWLRTSSQETREWVDASLISTSTATMTPTQSRALLQELMEVLERHADAAEASKITDAADEARRVRVYLSLFPLPADNDD